MNIKKTLLISSIAAAMGVTTAANAAFTPLVDGHYKLEITGGCFGFGNCVTGGTGALTDNTTVNQANTSGLTSVTYGSGIINDGLMGVIDFTLAGGSISVTSFSQDAYQGTAGGTFYLRSTNNATMGGTITGSTMSFDPTGRQGLAASFLNTLGEQPWNYDNYGSAAPKATDKWVTGTSTNRKQGLAAGFSLTGTPLTDVSGGWSGILVSAGNIGTAWGSSFQNTQFSEQFNVKLLLVDPVANADTASGPENTPIVIKTSDLMLNDKQTDGDPLSFVSFTQPKNTKSGVVDNGNGTLTYTPDAALKKGIGVDSFTYTIKDAKQGTAYNNATATVSITLTALGAIAPVASSDTGVTNEDKPLTFNPVVNDTDANPGQTATLIISTYDKFSKQGGTITLATGTTNLTYTPKLHFSGTDTFAYTIQDTDGLTSTATVTITVALVNHNPVCPDVTLSTGTDKVLTINAATRLIANCTDIDGDKVSFSTETPPANSGAMISGNGAGTLTYTPAKGFKGNDSFTFTAIDGKGGSVTAKATIKVGPQFGNFTMLNASGDVFGGTNDIVFTWDGKFDKDASDTNIKHMTITSVKPQPFFSFIWHAHNIRVFGPGTYKFDTTCTVADYSKGITTCNRPFTKGQTKQFITMTVGPNQVGAHILFDWRVAKNIDVVNVWDKNASWNRHSKTGIKNKLFAGTAGVAPDPAAKWALVSTDVNGDGFNGSPMVDGPFIGYYANFNSMVNLPLGSTIESAKNGNVKPLAHTQGGTKIGNSGLASLSLLSLFAALSTLLGLRWLGKKTKKQ